MVWLCRRNHADKEQDPTAMVVANQADTGLFLRDVSIDKTPRLWILSWSRTVANVQQEDTLFTT